MISLNAIQLPAALQWVDEFNWQPVAQSARRTLAGGLVLQESALVAGRPVTLQSRPDSAWMTRAVLEQLYALAAVAGHIYPLQIRGASHSVRFNYGDGTAIEAEPLFPMADPQATDYYLVTIKLITV